MTNQQALLQSDQVQLRRKSDGLVFPFSKKAYEQSLAHTGQFEVLDDNYTPPAFPKLLKKKDVVAEAVITPPISLAAEVEPIEPKPKRTRKPRAK
jgi:hypothetical protein